MQFQFSIIIPIYNAEKYLSDAIESIINQTVGLNNIQIILINDGSKDDSANICKQYQEQYPKNIVYIEQKNQGVSVARNNGLQYANGEIINFLDADDKWQLNACEKVKSFMDKHKEIDVVACELEYFEAKSGLEHPLNWKFNKDKTINILMCPSEIQMHIASCFIRREALNGYIFKKELKYGEDSLLVNQIILDKKLYGVLESVHYFYRKRYDESSAIDKCRFNNVFYLPTLEQFHFALINECKTRFNKIPEYIQFVLMYDLQWRIKRTLPQNVLNYGEIKQYKHKLSEILSYIDDDIIFKQRNLWREHKIFALSLKYKTDITNELEQLDGHLYFNLKEVSSLSNNSIFKIAYVKVKNKTLHIEALLNTPINKKNYKIIASTQTNQYEPTSMIDCLKREKICLYGHYYYDQYVTFDIPLNDKSITKVSFMFSYKDSSFEELLPGYTETCRLNTSSKKGFLKTNNNIIERQGNKIVVRNNSKKLHLKRELKYDIDLFKNNLWKLAIYRLFVFLFYYIPHKDIWIVSDRINTAKDNGEYFFRYLQTIKTNKKIYFAISKHSEDYERLKLYGKILDTNSIKYKLLFLLSSKIISSQANDETINPFGLAKRYIKDIYRFDFIFLQHGIIKDDLSDWLNKTTKDIKLFVTSTEQEYNSLLNGNYYYGKDVIKLTGLPRYDFLNNNADEKKIAIIPTWRKYIDGCIDEENNSQYNPNFKETEFYKFYNSLINNKKLLSKMNELGYKGIFSMHPLFEKQNSHFTSNDVFSICSNIDYKTIFEKYNLLVTDYSSIFFDFGYLQKPIVYTQFDKDRFFKNHSYHQGYFSYEKDGFGEVTYNVDDAVDAIIRQLENNCELSIPYSNRIKNCFSHEQGHNCENVYNEIIAQED